MCLFAPHSILLCKLLQVYAWKTLDPVVVMYQVLYHYELDILLFLYLIDSIVTYYVVNK